MFGKKKKGAEKLPPTKMIGIVRVIPDIFYGGNDPAIYHGRKIKDPSRELPHQKLVKMKPEKKSFALSRQSWFLILGVLFLAVVGGSAWYFVREAQQNLVSNTPAPAPVELEPVALPPPLNLEIEEPVIPQPATTTEEIALPTSSLLSLPNSLLADSVDFDVDTLTDAEEEIITTDSALWDSDGDGYYDGQEFVNLYNPKGVSPEKLIDSGIVKEYVNSAAAYRMYYPNSWQPGDVDGSGSQVLFSAISGEYVEVRAFSKSPNTSFSEWFGGAVSNQSFTHFSQSVNRFGVGYYERSDRLVAFFPREGVVYALIYRPGLQTVLNYRRLFLMMVASFRPENVLGTLPTQTPLPVAPPAI